MTTLRESMLHVMLLFYAIASVFLRFTEFHLTMYRTSRLQNLSFANNTVCTLTPVFLNQHLQQLHETLPLLRLLSDHQFFTDVLLNCWSLLALLPLAYLTCVRIRLTEMLITASLILRFLHSLAVFSLTIFPLWVSYSGVLLLLDAVKHLLGGDMFFYALSCSYIIYAATLVNEVSFRTSLSCTRHSSRGVSGRRQITTEEEDDAATTLTSFVDLYDASIPHSIDERLADAFVPISDLILYLLRIALVYIGGSLLGFVGLFALNSIVVLVDCDLSIFAYMNTLMISISCAYYLNFVVPTIRSLRRILSDRRLRPIDRSRETSSLSVPRSPSSSQAATPGSQFRRLVERYNSFRALTLHQLRHDYHVSLLKDLRSCSFPARLTLFLALLFLLASLNVLPYSPFTLDGQLLDVYVVTQRFSASVLLSSNYYFYQLLRISSYAVGIFIGHMLLSCVRLTFCLAMILSFAITVSSFLFYLAVFRLGGLVSFYVQLFDTFRFVALALLTVVFLSNFREPCRTRHLTFRLTFVFVALVFLRAVFARANTLKFVSEFASPGPERDDRAFASAFFVFSTVNVVALAVHPVVFLLFAYLRCLLDGSTCDYIAHVCNFGGDCEFFAPGGGLGERGERGRRDVELTNMHQLQIAAVHRQTQSQSQVVALKSNVESSVTCSAIGTTNNNGNSSSNNSPYNDSFSANACDVLSLTPPPSHRSTSVFRRPKLSAKMRFSPAAIKPRCKPGIECNLPSCATEESGAILSPSPFKHRPDSPYAAKSWRFSSGGRPCAEVHQRGNSIFGAMFADPTSVSTAPILSSATLHFATLADGNADPMNVDTVTTVAAPKTHHARFVISTPTTNTRGDPLATRSSTQPPPIPVRPISMFAASPPPKPKRSAKVVRFASEIEKVDPIAMTSATVSTM